MTQQLEAGDRREATLARGLESLRQSPEFRGPAAPLDDHDHGRANDHFALIYETREEQFAAAIPFIREGLERDERCMYITYENSREEVLEAMRAYGIDADAALESGALSIHTEREAYLRNETFDADDTIGFLDAAIEEATEEYEALRVTGEMSSVLEEDPDGEELVRCEAKANYLFDDVEGIALCQYNRRRFPPEVIRDVISTHPHIVHDNRVSHNVYYTPPKEFFGPEKSAREVDRLMGTLREQTDAKTELEKRERYLREQAEIMADPDQSFEQRLQALFDLGCERFDLELGAMACVDPDSDGFVLEYTSDDHEHFEPGTELPLSETYCTAVTGRKGVASVSDPIADGYEDTTVYREFGLRAYLGTYVEIDGGPDRTFFFVASEPRREPFSAAERTFHRLMGQWVRKELEREHYEAKLQQKNDRLESFASMLAHELRNPTMIGQIYSQQLPNDTASEAVGYVTEAFDRIEDIIDVMLVLTRGHDAMNEGETAKLADATDEVWADVRVPEATLEVSLDRTIEADETYVRHLFRNLLENAVEHGGTDVSITVGELPTGFFVADDGPGIPREDRDAVFEPGYTTTADNGGTGIGLAFVEKLAEVYEWDVAVTESATGGARFEFTNVFHDPE